MSARLHVFLGQGGVGKTTLAASTALALARRGRRVGLLGVDPSGRLRDALGMSALSELETAVPGAPGLHAAILRPGDSLRRWAREELGDGGAGLLRNAYFLALADRLGAATDLLAGVRIAEWAEANPLLDDLVLDTAPGLNGIELLGKPDQLLSLLQGRLLRWLAGAAKASVAERAGRRVLRGLARIGGRTMVVELAEFSLLIERLAAAMIARLQSTRDWLRQRDTRLLLVCAAGTGSAQGVRALAEGLRALGLSPAAAILNRALPEGAVPERSRCENEEALAFYRLISATMGLQDETARQLSSSFRLVTAPLAAGLDEAGPLRLTALEAVGASLLDALSAQ